MKKITVRIHDDIKMDKIRTRRKLTQEGYINSLIAKDK